MDIRQITPRYSVSPQINPEDFAAIKAAGFTKVICNRPDVENPPSHQADAMAAADPPDDPPGTQFRCHGLDTAPYTEYSLEDPMANSSILVLPTGINPASMIF